MSRNFFDRLEAELGGLARRGTHLQDASNRDRRRLVELIRRSAVIVVLAVVLAASLVSEFPASAGGHVLAAPALIVRGL